MSKIFRFAILNLITLFLSFVDSTYLTPPPSWTIPFNVEHVDIFCMQAISDPEFHIAFRYLGHVPNPQPILDIVGKAIINNGQSSDYRAIDYTLKRVHKKCPSSFVYSNANLKFDTITLQFDVFTGFISDQALTSFDIVIYPDIKPGWNQFYDKLEYLSMYAYYNPGLPTFVPGPLPTNATQTASVVNENQFALGYICLSTDGDISGIKANFGERSQNMPKYKAVFARVYDGQIPVSIKRVPAWPCPGDNTFHTYNNPVIIVDNGLSDPQIYWTFEQMESSSRERLISLSDLKKGNYFQTNSIVRLLSDKSDWLSTHPHLFTIVTKKYKVVDVNNRQFTLVRSVVGGKLLLLYENIIWYFSDRTFSCRLMEKRSSIHLGRIIEETQID